MSKVRLQRARIVTPICQCVSTGVPQHVGMRLEGELCLDPGPLDHAGKPCGAEGRSPFRREHKGRLRLLLAL